MADNFATRLTALRERAGLSQYRLAQLTGLTRQAMSLLEMGDTAPSWLTVQLIALALDVSYDALADPTLSLPEDEVNPRGRPPKVEREEATGGNGDRAAQRNWKRKLMRRSKGVRREALKLAQASIKGLKRSVVSPEYEAVLGHLERLESILPKLTEGGRIEATTREERGWIKKLASRAAGGKEEALQLVRECIGVMHQSEVSRATTLAMDHLDRIEKWLLLGAG
jgi:transcriptional regulator with XRE-family HTH domain